MPKYELMYILSSAVSDTDAQVYTQELDKFITENGKLLSTENLGKKKLAYPIKKTRNGFYILSVFEAEGGMIGKLENKIRSQENIIRFIVVNLMEQERRAAKDAQVQAKMKLSRKPQPEAGAVAEETPINLTETELEKKIEQALESEDLAK